MTDTGWCTLSRHRRSSLQSPSLGRPIALNLAGYDQGEWMNTAGSCSCIFQPLFASLCLIRTLYFAQFLQPAAHPVKLSNRSPLPTLAALGARWYNGHESTSMLCFPLEGYNVRVPAYLCVLGKCPCQPYT